MELLQPFQDWARGELLQAKIMIAVGAILLVLTLFVYRSNNEIVNGILIPLCLLTINLIGYGGFMIQDRNSRLSIIQSEYAETSFITFDEEKRKIAEGIESCKITIKIWCAIIAIGIGLSLFFQNPYYKGVAIGIILLGISLLLIDVFIDNRAKEIYSIFA